MRQLNPKELNAYSHVPTNTLRRVRVIEGVPIPGFAGITLGNFVFLKTKVSDAGDSTLLAHELVHVRQWSELGKFGFLTKYLSSFFRHISKTRSWMGAYRAIGREVEARHECDHWAKNCQDSSDE